MRVREVGLLAVGSLVGVGDTRIGVGARPGRTSTSGCRPASRHADGEAGSGAPSQRRTPSLVILAARHAASRANEASMAGHPRWRAGRTRLAGWSGSAAKWRWYRVPGTRSMRAIERALRAGRSRNGAPGPSSSTSWKRSEHEVGQAQRCAVPSVVRSAAAASARRMRRTVRRLSAAPAGVTEPSRADRKAICGASNSGGSGLKGGHATTLAHAFAPGSPPRRLSAFRPVLVRPLLRPVARARRDPAPWENPS